jgi:hypothetical protein
MVCRQEDTPLRTVHGSAKYRILPVLHPDPSYCSSRSLGQWVLCTKAVLNGLSLSPVSTLRTAAIAWIRLSSGRDSRCFVGGHRLQNSACNAGLGDGRRRISGAEARKRENGRCWDLLREDQGHRRP